MSKLPYFDLLLNRIQHDPESEIVQALGTRHVHWGYFPSANVPDPSTAQMAAASEAMTERMCAIAGISDGMRVLDVGCGFGGTIASINERFKNVDLVGLNIDGRQLARARELVKPQPGNKIEFIEGDACQLPLSDRSFDAVLAVECIFHFPSRTRFLREARRVLRPAGRLAVSDMVPPMSRLPLFLHATKNNTYLVSFYGSVNPMPITPLGYRVLARLCGLKQTEDENATPKTLPTYRLLNRLYQGNKPLQQMNQGMELLATRGIVQYHLMGFAAA